MGIRRSGSPRRGEDYNSAGLPDLLPLGRPGPC